VGWTILMFAESALGMIRETYLRSETKLGEPERKNYKRYGFSHVPRSPARSLYF
jgi:hypothetical protein